jgi:hypothetical protein
VIRCPFCTFDRSHVAGDHEWSAVQSMREVAVHVVLAHPDEFNELAQTVSDEWIGAFPRAAQEKGETGS